MSDPDTVDFSKNDRIALCINSKWLGKHTKMGGKGRLRESRGIQRERMEGI